MNTRFDIGQAVHARIMTLVEKRDEAGRIILQGPDVQHLEPIKEEVVHLEFDGVVEEIRITADEVSYKCSHDETETHGHVWVLEGSLSAA